MRIGVLDVGSNTVHLLIVDAHPGAAPVPTRSDKAPLRLAEHLEADGSVHADGIRQLAEFVEHAKALAEDRGCQSLVAFATSAIRDAPNGAEVLAAVRERTGVELQTLNGEAEARLTFHAIRRWFGWSAGKILAFDIGGGSLEIAVGADEEPDAAISLPLGAGRLTRNYLPADPPKQANVRELRKFVRARIAEIARDINRNGDPDMVVGSSKTFRTLARICGAAPSREGPRVERTLALSDVSAVVGQLAEMSSEERCDLPGVGASRAPQLVAGAIVAEATMDIFDVAELTICPWALREGILLRHLDQLALSDDSARGQ